MRFHVLDGWRGISILCVLAAHLLPLGPKSWQLNKSAANLGMSLFFTLSGFLITRNLLEHGNVRDFAIRRIFRILPLSLLYLILVLGYLAPNLDTWLSHLSFTVNYFSEHFLPETLHYWSLCVEIHFYLIVGLLVLSFGRKALYFLPLGLLAVTLLIALGTDHGGMKTHLRMDQILGGGVLALIISNEKIKWLHSFVASLPFYLLLLLLMVTSFDGLIQYDWLRVYAAMLLVGHTLAVDPDRYYQKILGHSVLFYIAEISFALYVIHPIVISGWLGSGQGLEKYLKRPIAIMVIFLLAHVSTRYFERYFIYLGKKSALISLNH